MADGDVFPLDGEGYSDVGEGRDVPAGKEQIAQIGVESCPVAALRLKAGVAEREAGEIGSAS